MVNNGISGSATIPHFSGELRLAAEENLCDCAAFEDAARYVPVYREMLARGSLVLFGYLQGECVFRSCLQCGGRFAWQGCTVRNLRTDEALVHYVYCAPASRKRGFHGAALRYFRARHPSATFYAAVNPDNTASLRGFLHNGYQVQSLITVKNRLFRRTLSERPLTQEEAAHYASL